ncbi:cell wall-active antibiotics response protein LiaF [Paenibacillus ginsengarvi]|nr:cell wall-active antibiotics response protein LiaF [Paenibacillus ginsengarvi]
MKNGFWGKSIGGFILIAIGVIFFLNQIDIIQFDLGYILSHFWPVVLIVIGLNGVLSQRCFNLGSLVWGGFMIALGLVFLNKNFNWVSNFGVGDLVKYAIPVILIVIGIGLLFRPRTRPPISEPEPYTPKDWRPYSSDLGDGGEAAPGPDGPGEAKRQTPPGVEQPASGSQWGPHGSHGAMGWHQAKQEWKRRNHEWRDELRQRKRDWKRGWKQSMHDGHHGHHGHHHDWSHGWSHGEGVDNRHNFIGDIRIGRDYWELKPLNISHFVGDTEIDLTRANIPFGETTINISSFVGDVKIFVPNDLQLEISVRASAFLGDMSVFDRWEGGLFRNMKAESPQYFDAEKRIKVNVSTFIGDVRVKRVG